MEVRDFCLHVVRSEGLDAKLAAPRGRLSDRRPGPALRAARPGRSEDLRIVPVSRAKVPGIEGMSDPAQRRRIVHAMANHELQAVELFAWALLAFPGAPAEFRRGLLRVLREEQMHVRLYLRRLESLGLRLGTYPVSGYFWNKVRRLETPAQFVCAMSLTFENANLDHTIDYARAAREARDEPTARILERIHRDEVGHVRFGLEWLERFDRAERREPGHWSAAEAYLRHVTWPLRPAIARGRVFHAEGRRAAGLDEAFIRLLESTGREAGP